MAGMVHQEYRLVLVVVCWCAGDWQGKDGRGLVYTPHTMWEEDRQQDKNCGFVLCHQVTTRDGEDDEDDEDKL